MVREVIRKKLYDAATLGDATTFQEQLQEDPYLLDVVSFPDSRNLLHIATRSGQASIVEEILRINQHLAWSLDSQKSSPLHIAAAKGTVEIASKLLAIAPQTCWLRDCHGMNPVHIAAMNGHVEILEEFIRHDRLPATEKVDHRQTVLHLCVKHGQLRVLQVLVNHFRELVHLQDDYGETVLHLAVRYKQVEIVRYLVENTGVEYQCSRNSNRETALDISRQSPQDTIQSEIRKILEQITTIKFSINKVPIEVVLGILALITGMTFQAAINPPGGVWQDDSATHKAGTPIMASTNPEKYQEFMNANMSAFLWSVFTIIGLCMPTERKIYLWMAILTGFFFSLVCFCESFTTSTSMLNHPTKHRSLIILAAISSFYFLGFVPCYRYGPPMVSSFCNYVRAWRQS
ncbi:ankyrin repeat-containing protein At5g02620-like isoform X1 [Salvia miltiorrhiza]|uniref:ankyrin repeat-containing protein At5g02620-like isoform X1 n=1 Tax=Salvia miltiorrhiza TaxID=226208 RepID=UPI0025AD2BDB|nr:ankyrin repeat-containing protein At5g02620-like isoform X1 [Salvia miltiorrhiza]